MFSDWLLSLSIMFEVHSHHMCHSFLLPNNISLYDYAAFFLFIHQSVDIWIVSTFWSSQIMLLCYECSLTSSYVGICLFLFLLDIYLEVGLLDHTF